MLRIFTAKKKMVNKTVKLSLPVLFIVLYLTSFCQFRAKEINWTPDGSAIYALLHAGGRIVRLDAASGRVTGEVPGSGYDRLAAVVPW